MPNAKQIIHWTLHQSNRRLTCIERPIPNGSKLLVLYDGLPVATCTTSMSRVVKEWAQHLRREWESAGWRIAPSH